MMSGGGVGWKGGECTIQSSQKGKKRSKWGTFVQDMADVALGSPSFPLTRKPYFCISRNEESFVIFIFCFRHDQNGDLHPSHLKETLLWTWTPSCWLNLGGLEVRIDNQRTSFIDQKRK